MRRRRSWAGTALLVALGLAASCGSDGDGVVRTTTLPTVEATFSHPPGTSAATVAKLVAVLRARLDSLDLGDFEVRPTDGNTIRVRITPAQPIDLDATFGLVGRPGVLLFRPVLARVRANPGASLGTGTPGGLQITEPADDDPARAAVLAAPDTEEDPALLQLGPAELTGSIIERANATLTGDGRWAVALVIRAGTGIGDFNRVAASCSPPGPVCPTGQLAIVLDTVVASAPTIQAAHFERNDIQISGTFSEDEAKELALVLRYGSLPSSLTLESVQRIEP